MNNTRVQVASPDQPWHDVQVRIIGQGAGAICNVFSQRWIDHPDSAAIDQSKFKLDAAAVAMDFSTARSRSLVPSVVSSSTSAAGQRATNDLQAVGIGRTYAALPKFSLPSSPRYYAFARSGEETAWRLIENGIKNTRRFLYIEDQYFVSRRLRSALVSKLADQTFQFLLVLMQSSASFDWSADITQDEFPYLIAARNEIRTDFAAVDPGRKKWGLFVLKASSDTDRRLWCGSYVHSKTFIFDDECAIVGSANADDRGYTFDSELVACITEDPLGRAAGQRFARDLRVNLWHKHLGVGQQQLVDWPAALNLWKKPPASAMVTDASGLEDSALLGPKPVLRNFTTEDSRWRESIDPDADLLP